MNRRRQRGLLLRYRVGGAAIGLLCIASMSSCAADGGVDVAMLEAQLGADLLSEHPGLVSSVDCPADIRPQAGDEVTCVATIGASPADVVVTFGKGKGVAAATVVDRLVDVVTLNRLAAERLSADLQLPIQLACPYPVMVLDVDDEVICIATDERGIDRELGLVVDEAGVVDLRLNVAAPTSGG